MKHELPEFDVVESDRNRAKEDNWSRHNTSYDGRRYGLMYYCRERQLLQYIRAFDRACDLGHLDSAQREKILEASSHE